DFVAVQLKGADVGERPDKGLAVVFVARVRPAGCRPMKAKIVFEKMLTKQVLLQVQYLGKVVTLHLHIRFTNLLSRRRDLLALFYQQNSLGRIHQKMSRQRQAGQSGTENDDVIL